MSGILAIDQATVVGWAFCEPGLEPVWGHKRMGKVGAWEGRAYLEFRNLLFDRIDGLRPDHLAFEAPFIPRPDRSNTAKPFSLDQTRRALGFVSQITEIAEECNLACHEYQTAEAVKFLTGKGRFQGATQQQKTAAKKQATVDACLARGWRVTHDEADALALLMCCEWRLFPEASLRRRMTLKLPRGPLFEAY